MDYISVNDDRLLEMAAHGDREAEDQLVSRYNRLVKRCARPLFLAGGDSEDLIQEGLMGLLSAVREYDPGSGASFKTYAELCIKRRLISAVKSASSLKHIPLNDGVPLEDLLSDDSIALLTGAPETTRVLEEQVLARESRSEIARRYSQCLSKLENQILSLYLDGWSYQEMASFTGKTVKSVDNAVQRIRRKLAHKPRPGDNS